MMADMEVRVRRLEGAVNDAKGWLTVVALLLVAHCHDCGATFHADSIRRHVKAECLIP